MRKKDLIATFGTLQEIANLFNPPLSRSAISQWGEEIPKLRQYELREMIPGIDNRLSASKKRRAKA